MVSSALDNPARVSGEEMAPGARRMIASAVASVCAALLGVAAFVTPASAGVGTHQQLNLPQCGWISLMDTPCVTCGMTTAFSHAARGSFLQSILAQPMGFVLAMTTAMALLVALHVAVTGSQVTRLFARLWTMRAIWLVALLTAGSWAFKIGIYKGIIA